MSINLFFIILAGLLIGMFNYFSPDYAPSNDIKDIPQIELTDFTLYEISSKGIDHILEGKEGKKFDDHYVITSAKFSDNTKNLFQTIRSDHADYRNDIIALNGHVHYLRDDGLEFHSAEGSYNSKTSLVQTIGSFVINKNTSSIDGTSLHYNTAQDTVSADRVHGSYQLK